MWCKLAAEFTVVLAATCALAQENGPPGLLRGELLSWTGTDRGGQFTFRASENHTYFCTFDHKTYFERETQRTTMAGIDIGDRLEIVSDERPGSHLCYARTVHVIDAPRLYVVPGVRPHLKKVAATSPFLPPPRGNIAVSGAVLHVYSDLLVLRSRAGKQQVIQLRPDTRYLADGQTTDWSSLAVNTVVYVRAGKNLDNQLEAFQVVWGAILQPTQ